MSRSSLLKSPVPRPSVPKSSGRGRRAVTLTAAAAIAAVGVSMLGPSVGNASSHREAPIVAGEPKLDNTDVYAFVSPDKPDTVTLVANWLPFEEQNGGPNFYAFATNTAYDINIDSNGDATPDVTYRWRFFDNYRNKKTFLYNTGPVTSLDDPDLNFYQTYRLERITGDQSKVLVDNARVAPRFVGKASMPNYQTLADAAVTSLPKGGKTFAGQADDPFFLDLRVFDLLYGANLTEVGQDTVRGYNVNTIALQVPKSELALRGDPNRNPVIGIWSTTSRQRVNVAQNDNSRVEFGGVQHVSRLGMPLVHHVGIPGGPKDRVTA